MKTFKQHLIENDEFKLPFLRTITIPYRKDEITLVFNADINGKYISVRSYWDREKTQRAWQSRYDNKIFNTPDDLFKLYKSLRKKAKAVIKEVQVSYTDNHKGYRVAEVIKEIKTWH